MRGLRGRCLDEPSAKEAPSSRARGARSGTQGQTHGALWFLGSLFDAAHRPGTTTRLLSLGTDVQGSRIMSYGHAMSLCEGERFGEYGERVFCVMFDLILHRLDRQPLNGSAING